MSKATLFASTVFAASLFAATTGGGFAAGDTEFSDDFSTNPLTNGKWSQLYADAKDGGEGLVWDQPSESLLLAKGAPAFTLVAGATGAITADYTLPDTGWTAEFDYRVGGGSVPAGFSPSDGLLIRFNAGMATVSGNPVSLGYFLFLDNFRNAGDPASNYVGLYYANTPPSPGGRAELLDWVADGRTRDDQWHHAKLSVGEGRIRFYIDDMQQPVLDHTVAAFDLSRRQFGFLALTRTDDIRVDDVVIAPAQAVSSRDTPVLLVHGYMGSTESFGDLESILESRGFSTVENFDYSAWTPRKRQSDTWKPTTIGQLAGLLHHRIVDEVLPNSPGDPSGVDVVAHSMGGLVARAYIAGLAEDEDGPIAYPKGTIRRVVTLGTPNYGVDERELAALLRALSFPLGKQLPLVQADQMDYASAFTMQLHDRWAEALAEGAFAKDALLSLAGLVPNSAHQSWDGVVHSSSAALPDGMLEDPRQQVRYVRGSHIPWLGEAGIARIESDTHAALPAIEAFLAEGLPGLTQVAHALDPAPEDLQTLLIVRVVDAAGKSVKVKRVRVTASDGTDSDVDGVSSGAFLVQGDPSSDLSHSVTIELKGKKYESLGPIDVGPITGRPIVLPVLTATRRK